MIGKPPVSTRILKFDQAGKMLVVGAFLAGVINASMPLIFISAYYPQMGKIAHQRGFQKKVANFFGVVAPVFELDNTSVKLSSFPI